jgi:hypothetical protein
MFAATPWAVPIKGPVRKVFWERLPEPIPATADAIILPVTVMIPVLLFCAPQDAVPIAPLVTVPVMFSVPVEVFIAPIGKALVVAPPLTFPVMFRVPTELLIAP